MSRWWSREFEILSGQKYQNQTKRKTTIIIMSDVLNQQPCQVWLRFQSSAQRLMAPELEVAWRRLYIFTVADTCNETIVGALSPIVHSSARSVTAECLPSGLLFSACQILTTAASLQQAAGSGIETSMNTAVNFLSLSLPLSSQAAPTRSNCSWELCSRIFCFPSLGSRLFCLQY